MYAAIRLRGTVNVTPNIKKALDTLGLTRINNMTLWKENEQNLKMVKMAKDYVTFGKINEETLKELVEKKAVALKSGDKIDAKKIASEIAKGKTPKETGIKNLFKLSPPRGGFEREGVKVPYTLGGALGDRKEKINELIKRMI
jgi:large subunit ribosomal protein L30